MCLLAAASGKERKSKIVLQCYGYQLLKKVQQIGEVPEKASTDYHRSDLSSRGAHHGICELVTGGSWLPKNGCEEVL